MFIVDDLLSILPSVAVLNSGFKRFRLFRLNKALRLLRYSKSFNLIISAIRRERRALPTGIITAGYRSELVRPAEDGQRESTEVEKE